MPRRSTPIPNPSDTSVHKTERSVNAELMYWMRKAIEEEHIPLGYPDVEMGASDGKFPDMVIYESPRSNRVLCVIEAKPPRYDIFNYDDLKKPAHEKAVQRKARYFAVTNFRALFWYSTEKATSMAVEEEQIANSFDLHQVEGILTSDEVRFNEPMKRSLSSFLRELYEVATGRKPEPKIPVDELLVYRLRETILALSGHYHEIIDDRCHKEPAFRERLQTWFLEQGWEFSQQDEELAKAARQTAYLLVNKLLFYNALQTKRPDKLDPLEIPQGTSKGSVLQKQLRTFFEEALEIDYETVFTTDFIDTLAFPDNRDVVSLVKTLVSALGRYNFATLGYDIIGRIFEQLIPETERHNLGQYFTSPDVVDLILRYCHTHENQKILDPSCGAGTFLVRAYEHKKFMNQNLNHEDLLRNLWGNDIAKFPAHLSTINLAIRGLDSDENYPNILQQDFFALHVGNEGFEAEDWRKKRAKTLGIEERLITYPRWFDAIVGNPPYTRQEEIPEIGVNKAELIRNALKVGDRAIANISKRAGIHAYFFVHGWKFLRDGGRFGFIVSNSWLDVDYGKGIQEFFLQNFKIVAVIESKVERWFDQADINTCIVILEKCGDAKKRADNLTRFVRVKRELRNFIPAAQEDWRNLKDRFHAIDNLIRTISAHDEVYENEDLRVFPIPQAELWGEGHDEEKNEFTGAKWGKYLRAPDVFFTILSKGKGKLVPLKSVAEVRRGFTTGANEFFYLTHDEIKRWGIEEEFWKHPDANGNLVPNAVIVSPKEGQTVVPDPANSGKIVLFIDPDTPGLSRTRLYRYIRWGVGQKFNTRPTCKSRNAWFSLEQRDPWPIVFPRIHQDRQCVFANTHKLQIDNNLVEILPKKKRATLPLLCFLLSTVGVLFKELGGRTNLGEGALKTEAVDMERWPVFANADVSAMRKFRSLKRQFANPSIRSIFEEVGADAPQEVSLGRVRPDRRALDEIVMGDILGLTEDEQLEVYRSVIDLVRARLDRASSVGGASSAESAEDDSIAESAVKTIAHGDEL